jgi:hypothetical protein
MSKDIQLTAIITKQDLQEYKPDPTTIGVNDFVLTVLAQHKFTDQLQVLVESENQGEVNKFKSDFPDAIILTGDGTPENHEEWRMLLYPTETKGETSPLSVFRRGRTKESDKQKLQH